MHKVILQPAYLLHARAYRESSLLADVLTRDAGRLTVVARGVQRRGSRFRGLLQPFKRLCLSCQGRGELYTMTDVAEAGTVVRLPGKALYCGLYLNELVTRLLHRHDPHPGLFDCYAATLSRLPRLDGLPRTLRLFEKRLLRELGYGLLLDREADTGRAIEPDLLYAYNVESGPVRGAAGKAGIPIHGASLLSLENDQLHDATSLKECRNLMRQVLQHYLGGRTLKSRELFYNQY